MIAFHWMFVALAGGMILFLFTMFITTAQKGATSSLSTEVILHFDTIFQNLATQSGLEAPIQSHRDVVLEFTCDLQDATLGQVNSRFAMTGGVSKSIDDIPVFSQNRVSGDVIYTSVSQFGVPFLVSSMIYVTDPNTLYVLEASDANRRHLARLLHAQATVVQVPTREFPAVLNVSFAGYRNVVIISADVQGNRAFMQAEGQGPVLSIPRGTNVYLYEVAYEGELLNKGTITGFELKQDRNNQRFVPNADVDIKYAEPSLLQGVIYSHSIEHARCVAQKVYNKIPKVAFVLAERASILNASTNNQRCKLYYNAAYGALTSIARNYEEYTNLQPELQLHNNRLEAENCALLY